jgi:Flp pilus assembly protein TadD
VLPRAKRRVGNPLDAAPAWQPPRQVVALSSSLDEAPIRPRRGLWYAAAAIGCAALVLGWLYLNGGQRTDGNAAMGALQQASVVTPSIAPTLEPHEAEPPPPAVPAPQPAAARPAAAPAAAAAPAVLPPASQPLAAGPASRTSRPGEPAHAAGGGSDADRAKALVDEGTSLLKQGRLGLAESSCQKALQLVPEYPGAIAALVRIHLVRKDGSEAVRWAKRLVAAQPSNGSYQLLLGDSQALYGDGDAAQTAWTAAAKAGNATARTRLAEE